MGYFPFFVDLDGKQGLIVGGGIVALRKIENLLPYGPQLTVAAMSFESEIEKIEGLLLLQKSFAADMLEGKYFVIAATDDRELNHVIANLCQEKNILVNVVDDREACTFIFPCLVKKGRLTAGISTEGASPSGAIYIKEKIKQWIPENFEEILGFLEDKRGIVKKRISVEGQRTMVFTELFEQCLEKGRALTEEEFEAVLHLAQNDLSQIL